MTGAIVLAAGASTRMGWPKALLLDGERTFLQRILQTLRAALIGPVVVVVAAPHGAAVQRAHADEPVIWVENPDPERGMLSSVQAGAQALADGPAPPAGALIWPVDVPRVQVATLHSILHRAVPVGVAVPAGVPVVPVHAGRGGHPLWLPAGLFPALLALPAAPGHSLRSLLQAQKEQVVRLPVEDADILLDYDAPGDFRGVRGVRS